MMTAFLHKYNTIATPTGLAIEREALSLARDKAAARGLTGEEKHLFVSVLARSELAGALAEANREICRLTVELERERKRSAPQGEPKPPGHDGGR